MKSLSANIEQLIADNTNHLIPTEAVNSSSVRVRNIRDDICKYVNNYCTG